jgi:hypothetical protein
VRACGTDAKLLPPHVQILKAAEAWSLFNPRIREQHSAAVEQLNSLAMGAK